MLCDICLCHQLKTPHSLTYIHLYSVRTVGVNLSNASLPNPYVILANFLKVLLSQNKEESEVRSLFEIKFLE
jgi:hypothetical protein